MLLTDHISGSAPISDAGYAGIARDCADRRRRDPVSAPVGTPVGT
jgi:hypothetical protein